MLGHETIYRTEMEHNVIIEELCWVILTCSKNISRVPGRVFRVAITLAQFSLLWKHINIKAWFWNWFDLNEPPKLHCLGQQAKDIQEAFEHCLSLFPPLKIAQYLRNANKMFHTCRADTRRLTILGLSWLKLVCWCLTNFILSKKPLKRNNIQTFPLLRAPDLWWACWQSEEAVQVLTPAGGLHICERKKRMKIKLELVFGLVTSWGQCDWC